MGLVDNDPVRPPPCRPQLRQFGEKFDQKSGPVGGIYREQVDDDADGGTLEQAHHLVDAGRMFGVHPRPPLPRTRRNHPRGR